MAQTTGALAAVNAQVEISTNGSAWTDISGSSNKVEPGGGDRQSGEGYTFDGDTAIIKGGKREPIELTLSFVYSEVAAEAWLAAETAYLAGSDFYVRYSPGGGIVGDFLYTSPAGIITSFAYPEADVEEAAPIMGEMTVKVAQLTRSTIV